MIIIVSKERKTDLYDLILFFMYFRTYLLKSFSDLNYFLVARPVEPNSRFKYLLPSAGQIFGNLKKKLFSPLVIRQ